MTRVHSVIENAIRLAVAGWEELSEDEIHFYLISDSARKNALQDSYNAERLDVPLEDTNLAFSSAPYVVLMAISQQSHKIQMGVLLGILQRSLLSCGVWTFLHLPPSQDDPLARLFHEDLSSSSKSSLIPFALLAVGYPTSNAQLLDHRPPLCQAVVESL